MADGIYTLNRGSLSVDVSGASRVKGAAVQLYATNHSAAQNFSLTNVSGGVSLRSVLSGRAITVDGQGRLALGDTTTAALWQLVGRQGQVQVQFIGGGAYQGRFLGTYGTPKSGSRLALGGSPVSLTLASTKAEGLESSSYVTVAPSGGSSASRVIDVAGGGTSRGTNVQLYASNGTAAQKWQIVYDNGTGLYSFRNTKSQRMLDVYGGGTYSGANVQLWDSNGTLAQRWAVVREGGAYRIYSALSGLSLDLSGANFSNGANMQIWAPNHTNAQRFLIQGTSVLSNGLYSLGNGQRVIDVAGGSLASGANIQLYGSNRTLAQKFYFRRTSGQDLYEVENAADGRLLTEAGGNAVKCDRLSGASATSQRWRLVPTWGGGFVLVNQGTGRALDLAGNRNANGTNVGTYARNGTNAQRWVPNWANAFDGGVIDLVGNGGMAVDVTGGSMANGANVQAWSHNGSLAQRWATVSLGNGRWELVNASSARVLDVNTGSGNVRQGTWLDYGNQKWSFRYLGYGRFSLVNDATGKALTMGSNQGANVYVAQSNGRAAQQFSVRETSLSEGARRSMVVKFASYMGSASAQKRFNSVYLNTVVVNDGGDSIKSHRRGWHCLTFCYFVYKYSGNQYAYGSATAWPGVYYNRAAAAGKLNFSPRPGDIALFYWSSNWNRPGYRASHAAIVDRVDGNGYWLYDDNTGGKYAHHHKTWGQWPLVGFAHGFF